MRIGTGLQIDGRIASCSQEDWEFIFTAVEAGWTTPRIMAEVSCGPAATFVIARYARQEMAQRHRVCEKCRRNIATGKIAA